MKVIDAGHPYWHVRRLVDECDGKIDLLSFSYYRYTPQSLADERKEFKLPVADFMREINISRLLLSAPVGYELAIHSLVHLREGSIAHIPMADMSSQSLAKLAKYRDYLDFAHRQQFSWYKSGRSFHGYGNALIDEADWSAYMGKLLLANEPGMPPVVDPRWVGHRLIGGYAALRWTNNTEHYKETPKKTS